MTEPAPRRQGPDEDDLAQRARVGVVALTSRGVLIAALGLGGQLLLTRLLVPEDFGAAAFGLVMVAFINLFADGGLGAALIRRPEPPERGELQALSGLQVSIATLLSVAIVTAAPFFGHTGWVTSVIALSAPILCMQIPARIMLERALRFDVVARAEVLQVLVFYIWAVALAVGGAGVWGLATAPLLRSVVGLVILTRASPAGRLTPHLSWSRSRPLLRFGLQFQSVTLLWLVRDQGLNVGIAAVGGIGTLGLATLGRRILEIPQLVLYALFRVSFPAMSQLVTRGDNLREVLERIVRVCATGMSLLLSGLAASGPGLVPALFGENWAHASDMLPAACLGLLVGGSVSVACQGYLFARDDAVAVIRSGIWQTVMAFAVALVLVPHISLWGVGLGLLASGVAESVVLSRAARRHTGARLMVPLVRPTVASAVGGALGWWVSIELGRTMMAGILGGSGAVLVTAGVLLLVDRHSLWDTAQLVGGATAALRRRTAPAADPRGDEMS